jgi:hypothetical protein
MAFGIYQSSWYETKHIGRYIGKMQWLMPFIGFDWRYRKNGNGRNRRESFGQSSTKDKRAVLVPV